MITGKTIAQLDLLTPVPNDTSIPVDSNGSTYRIQFQQITDKINAQGDGTIASGYSSHAEGNLTIAAGDYSHAEGYATIALGNNSHAEGNSTISVGNFSHSEGFLTTSTGDGSHSEGNSTNSVGYYSHSEGSSTTSIGFGSHSEGNLTESIGYYSHSEGYITSAGWFAYDVVSVLDKTITVNTNGEDVSSLFTSNKVILDTAILTYSSTSFNYPLFYINLNESLNNSVVSELTGGTIDPSGFDIIYTDGDDVYVEVYLPSGFTSNFLGVDYDKVYVSSNGYLTFGGGSSQCCFLEPQEIPTSVGLPGVYLSINNTDGLLYNLLTGYTPENAFVIRYEGSYRNVPNIIPDLIFNFVFYSGTPETFDLIVESLTEPNTSNCGVSDGIKDTFLASFTALTGTNVRISTNTLSFSYVNDLNNLANQSLPNVLGNYTHSEGFNNKSINRGSHSEGSGTVAIGEFSHSEGVDTVSSGIGSHSGGLGTFAKGNYQTVFGKYNTKDNSTSLFVIGNGTGDTSRSDIVLVDTTGITINGDLTITGTTNGIKKYVAVFTQESTLDPVVVVLENSLGGEIVWTRDSTGNYYGVLNGAFQENKTVSFYTHDNYDGNTGFSGMKRIDNNTIWVTFNDFDGNYVDIGDNSIDSIQIVVYP